MDSASQPALHATPSNGHKRKQSVTEEPGSERAIKHRSSKACQSCRARKVRCDITTNGTRCTNCRLDSLECIVVPSRRGKNNRTRRKKDQAESESGPAKDVATSHSEGPRRESYAGRDGGNEPVPLSVTFDEESDNIGSDRQPAAAERHRRRSDHATGGYEELLTPESGPHAPKPRSSSIAKAALPAFIAPLSNRIPDEDVDFLIMKGATHVPEPESYIEILRSYLFSVHPFMPMLDYRTFVPAVLNNRADDGRISLLLFQAVMFAGLHALPLDAIQRLGFESTKEAREVFFNRTRLLYEFDVEPDNAAVLQSLILMSTWYGRWDERRHTWHYTGLAYDMARNIGIHREPSARYSSDKIRHFRRRLWWSLYIRERMIALGTRRPMRIRDDEFDVTMLTLEDFDLEPFTEPHQGQPLLPNVKENTSTALMCIQLAKLCSVIGKVTSSQYTTLNSDPGAPNTMMVVPRRDGGGTKELERCNKELNEWFQSLTTNVRRNTSKKTLADPHSCSEVHWAVLNLTYLTVVNVLHRSQALKPLLDNEETEPGPESSRSKVKEAARGLTKLSQTMLRHDQVRFLGTVGVTALVAACLSHMLDISSGDEDVRDASTLRLYQSMEVLTALTSAYASADAAVSFLTSVTQKAGINIPAQVAAAAPSSTDNLSKPVIAGKQMPILPNLSGPATAHLDLLTSNPNVSTMKRHPSALPRYEDGTNGHSQSPVIFDGRGQIVTSSNSNNSPIQPFSGNGQLSPFTQEMNPANQPSIVDHQTPVLTGQLSTAMSVPHYLDPASHGVPAATGGDSLEWDNGMDMSMNLEPMAFTYDFYSDAFGFLDGRFQGM